MKTCTDWTVTNVHRHRSTTGGYADPAIADDLALRAIDVIERLRRERGMCPHQVVLCGVDNSTTAFAMAVIRLLPDHERYSFCSGRKSDTIRPCWDDGPDEGDEGYFGELSDGDYPTKALYVVLDDDICEGRALRTVASRRRDTHWIGINNYFNYRDRGEYDDPDEMPPEWIDGVTWHWWGASDVCEGESQGMDPTYRTEDSTDIWARFSDPDADDGDES